MSSLALFGGEKTVKSDYKKISEWPIVNKGMEEAVLEVLRNRNMSGMDITREFEKGFAEWHGVKYGLGFNTGTASLQTAMFAVGVGKGDEVICPSITYWASCTPALSLGASVVFADIDNENFCIDPDDFEKKITERTKAVIVVHYLGMPADMERICEIARKHNIKIIEDTSHAHGSRCKGKMCGTFGDAACFSLMTGKSFAIGEAGIMLTNDRDVYERAILFGHYARHSEIENPELKKYTGIPWGGSKYRMHQMSAAVGLEQLKKFPSEMEEIDKAMNYFWDSLEGVPGIKAFRPEKGSGSTMGAWYAAHGKYVKEELGGLTIKRFAEAVQAEGGICSPGCNRALHQHPLFHEIDVYGDGMPTQLANLPEGVDNRTEAGSLPVAEGIQSRTFFIPRFNRFDKEIIDEHVAAYRKVAENYKELLEGDDGVEKDGSWGLSFRR